MAQFVRTRSISLQGLVVILIFKDPLQYGFELKWPNDQLEVEEIEMDQKLNVFSPLDAIINNLINMSKQIYDWRFITQTK